MKVSAFEEADRNNVLQFHQNTFGRLNLERFLTKYCEQIESLEKECVKLVCRDSRHAAGYAAVYPVEKNSFRLNLIVDPQRARRGIGSSLLDAIESEAKRSGAMQIEARIIEGMSESLAFALSKNFLEVHRMHSVSLRAANFWFEKWRALGEKLSAEGFTVTTFAAEEAAGEKPLEKLVELQRRAVENWVLTGLSDEPDVSDAALRKTFSFICAPNSVSIMKYREKYVAYTSAERNNMLGTATHPEYRNRRIATFLKAANIKTLIDGGAKLFESSSANPAMLRVNENLGYELNGLTEIRLAKHL